MRHRLDEVCRVCESTEGLEVISNNSNRDILSMLQDVGQSKRERGNDHLPQHICHPCIFTLKDFHEFKSLYRSTYAKLKFGITINPMQLKVLTEKVTIQDSSVIDRLASCVEKGEMVLRPSCIREDENMLKKEFDLEEEFTNKAFLDLHGSNNVKNSDFHEMVVKEEIAVLGDYGEQELQATIDNTADVSEVGNETSHADTHSKGGSKLKSYKCEMCGRTFPNKYSLKRHAGLHSNPDLHKCEDCGKGFSAKEYLQKHKKNHSKCRTYKCDYCGLCFSTTIDLRVHKLTHSGVKLYKCDKCGDPVTRGDSLKKHQTPRCRHSKSSSYRCEHCGKTFAKDYTLQRHLAFHDNPDLYKCKDCGQVCTSSSHLKEHQKGKCHSTNIFKSNYSEKSCFPIDSLEKHEALQANVHSLSDQKAADLKQKHVCDECDKSFISVYRYRAHKALHANPDLFKCKDCGTRCRDPLHLVEHTRKLCRAKGPFKCTHCEKVRSTLDALEKHQVLHYNPEIYKCHECGKLFNNLPNLIRHKAVTHPSEKEHKCHICGKQFTSNYQIKSHIALHANPDLFKCEECGKSLGSSKSWRAHVLRHANYGRYKCEKCGKLFSESHVLRSHMAWHVNAVTCNECGKSFSHDSTLRNHRLKCSQM